MKPEVFEYIRNKYEGQEFPDVKIVKMEPGEDYDIVITISGDIWSRYIIDTVTHISRYFKCKVTWHEEGHEPSKFDPTDPFSLKEEIVLESSNKDKIEAFIVKLLAERYGVKVEQISIGKTVILVQADVPHDKQMEVSQECKNYFNRRIMFTHNKEMFDKSVEFRKNRGLM